MGELSLREQSSVLFQFLDDILVGVFDVLSLEVGDWVDEPSHSVQGTDHLTVWGDASLATKSFFSAFLLVKIHEMPGEQINN